MEIGIDSFASAMYGSNALTNVEAMEQLLYKYKIYISVATYIFFYSTLRHISEKWKSV